MSPDVGLRIAKNSLFNIARIAVTVPLTLIITPYIFGRLGNDEFGIWALVSVVSSYAQLSDFGLSESLIKFMAEHEARKDALRLNQFINTALVLYLIISAVFCAAFLSLMPAVVNDLLRIPGQYAHQAIAVFRIGIVLFFVNMIAGIFGSLITGFQQIAFSSLIGTASAVLTAAGTFFVLERGYGLMGLLYNNAVITAIVVLLNVLAAYRLFPHMQIRLFTYFTRDAARTMFGYAWKVQVSNISQLMIFQIDRVLLSRYVDLAAVGNYEVANRVASQMRALIASIFSPMLPAASALHASADGTWIPGLYARSFKYLAVVAIPCSLLVVACAQPFMRSWMGPGFSVSAVTLQVLMVAYMLNLLTGPGAFILGGINRPHIGMRSSVFAGIVNLALCIALVQTVGYYGIIAGILFSIVSSGLYFIRMVHQQIPGLSWTIYRRTLLRPLLLAGVLCCLFIGIDHVHPLQGYLLLTGFGVFFFFVVLIGLFRSDYFDDFDRVMIAKLMPFRTES